ncbi:MAG: LemA family protein [Alphaproteobacteria bacterium]|nr:LemA family protein [Alphaproteobacteria bacterium]
MEILGFILVGAVVIVVFVIMIYNRLVALRQNRQNAFADIDVQLKLRADLVPNLVETVKGYATHEETVFTQVTQARAEAVSASGVKNRADSENALGLALTNLMAVAENYPDLKASEQFRHLQMELGDIENKIASARRFLNNSTREYNTAIEQFPNNIVANFFNFSPAEMFDVGSNREELEKPVSVSFSPKETTK